MTVHSSEPIITWPELRNIIVENRIGDLYRTKATMEKYTQFKHAIKKQNYTIVNYIITHRLGWLNSDGKVDTTPRSKRLFTDASDIMIITNDFSYNFEPDSTHLCVWTKLDIPSDPESEVGDVTDFTKAVIDRWVTKNFVETLGVPAEDVYWFRNFPSLQSVQELSHVHIVCRGLGEKRFKRVIDTSGVVLSSEEYEEIERKFEGSKKKMMVETVDAEKCCGGP